MPLILKEIALGLVLIVALALIVYGLALWFVPVAFIVGGLGVAGLGFYFFVEVG